MFINLPPGLMFFHHVLNTLRLVSIRFRIDNRFRVDSPTPLRLVSIRFRVDARQ